MKTAKPAAPQPQKTTESSDDSSSESSSDEETEVKSAQVNIKVHEVQFINAERIEFRNFCCMHTSLLCKVQELSSCVVNLTPAAIVTSLHCLCERSFFCVLKIFYCLMQV